MANKILIPLQSLICFLKLPTNRWTTVGAIEGLWRGYSPACPTGSTILSTLEAITQAGGGSSVLNLCAKDQANENWEHKSGT